VNGETHISPLTRHPTPGWPMSPCANCGKASVLTAMGEPRYCLGYTLSDL
jgi:hypothetical protein